MIDTTKHEFINEAVIKQLGKYLNERVPNLRSILYEFPNDNRQLKMPCVTITTGTSEFRPLAPYVWDEGDISSNKAAVLYSVGIYDYTLQLDLWCKTKEDRNDMFNLIFEALNPDIIPMGLRLQLEDYHSQWVSYVMDGHSIADTEERSQRNEWRITISILSTVNALLTRKQYMMTDVDQDEYDVGYSVEIPN